MRFIARKFAGFTLVELLVTISIMAIIMTASLVAFQGTRATARDGKRKADLEAARSALEIYRSDLGGYPATLAALSPTYISTPVADPLPTTQNYAYVPTNCGATTCRGYILCARIEIGSTTTYPECGSCGSEGACSYKTVNP
jgi:prepilin-type N-terminal cleavage/methylation domain-containing protein